MFLVVFVVFLKSSVLLSNRLIKSPLLEMMKYVLIHWTATNETCVLTEVFVRDKTMLEDFKDEEGICFGNLEV